jgi:hypothetical protein
MFGLSCVNFKVVVLTWLDWNKASKCLAESNRGPGKFDLFKPPLWSSGQSFWLLTRVPGSITGVARFFWAAVGLERGPLSLVNNLRSYLEEIVAAPGLENRSYDRRDSLRWPRDTFYPLKFALASLTGGDCSIGIVRNRTKHHRVFFFLIRFSSVQNLIVINSCCNCFLGCRSPVYIIVINDLLCVIFRLLSRSSEICLVPVFTS